MVGSRRTVLLLVALLVVAVSCGGDGSVFDTGTTTAPSEGADLVDAEALAVGEAIVDHLGPEPGMLAVGYALDRGHTSVQIAGAGLDGTLQADGTITRVEPELPPWGIFADLPEVGASGGGGPRAARPLAYADDGQVTATGWTRGLAGEFDAHVSGQPSLDEADQNMATVMIALILGLSDAGYSADQIILGIAADEWVLGFISGGDLGPTLCWHLRDADGYFVRPARTATGSFPRTAACRDALEQLAPPDTGSTTTTTAGSTTTTTVAAVDPDGITNGIYTGTVRLATEVGAPVYELSDTIVELEVTDDVVRATVEFTTRVSVRVRGVDLVCIATTSRVYFGQGSPAEPLDVLMEPQLQEILSLEGPECGVVEGWWETTAEADLLAEFAEERAFPLVGSFSNGTFEGTIAEILTVTAAIAG